jgi:uncharacterized membrane protein
MTSYSGILPPADMLVKYGDVVPDAPERILRMAEQQSEHRRKLEAWAVKGDMIRSFLGVACAFAIVVFTLYIGKLLIQADHPVGGYIFGGLGLASLVATFIYGTRSRREERVRRDQKSQQR